MIVNKIHIFSQTVTKRTFVGTLWRSDGKFYFEYDKKYRRLKNAVALGPEFELWKERFSSNTLFASLADRIPFKQNPAYKDYCKQWGISEDEQDPLVLLTTIGRRGPSTFVFEAAPNIYTPERLKQFRQKLKLNQREFASLFGITQVTLVRLESGKSSYVPIMYFIQLCEEVPQALKWLLNIRGQYINDNKRVQIEQLIIT